MINGVISEVKFRSIETYAVNTNTKSSRKTGAGRKTDMVSISRVSRQVAQRTGDIIDHLQANPVMWLGRCIGFPIALPPGVFTRHFKGSSCCPVIFLSYGP